MCWIRELILMSKGTYKHLFFNITDFFLFLDLYKLILIGSKVEIVNTLLAKLSYCIILFLKRSECVCILKWGIWKQAEALSFFCWWLVNRTKLFFRLNIDLLMFVTVSPRLYFTLKWRRMPPGLLIIVLDAFYFDWYWLSFLNIVRFIIKYCMYCIV